MAQKVTDNVYTHIHPKKHQSGSKKVKSIISVGKDILCQACVTDNHRFHDWIHVLIFGTIRLSFNSTIHWYELF